MPDLRNAFAPLQGTTSFQQPHFDNIAWVQDTNHANAAVYPGPMNAWPGHDASYIGQPDQGFGLNNDAFQSQPHLNGFTHTAPSTLPQGLPVAYHQDPTLMSDMNVSPGYVDGQFANVAATQAVHHSPPVAYGSLGNVHADYMPQDTMIYGGEQDQMHLHQVVSWAVRRLQEQVAWMARLQAQGIVHPHLEDIPRHLERGKQRHRVTVGQVMIRDRTGDL